MADFQSNQCQLAAARAARDAAQTSLSAALETLKQAQANLNQYLRRATTGDREDQEKARLERAVAEATAAVNQQKSAVQRANSGAEAALEGFASFTDPRQNLSHLSARSPFLLLPVRVETRFATVNEQHQLWVRIYPDDCSIDTFEPVLSASELANAKLYWEGIWAAGGIEAQQRGAWRSLVAAHGSARASWILILPAVTSAQPVGRVDR
jgi:hypothetical protein